MSLTFKIKEDLLLLREREEHLAKTIRSHQLFKLPIKEEDLSILGRISIKVLVKLALIVEETD
jgi:hypothetical protein